MGHGASLDAVAKRKISSSYQESNPGHPSHGIATILTELSQLPLTCSLDFGVLERQDSMCVKYIRTFVNTVHLLGPTKEQKLYPPEEIMAFFHSFKLNLWYPVMFTEKF
jgi:hypothetical protein